MDGVPQVAPNTGYPQDTLSDTSGRRRNIHDVLFEVNLGESHDQFPDTCRYHLAIIPHRIHVCYIWWHLPSINIPPVLAYIPYMDPMGTWSTQYVNDTDIKPTKTPLYIHGISLILSTRGLRLSCLVKPHKNGVNKCIEHGWYILWKHQPTSQIVPLWVKIAFMCLIMT